MTAPKCLSCNKPLKKRTTTIFFESPRPGRQIRRGAIAADVRTKEEAQRHTNLEVVSVQRNVNDLVWSAGVWDGTSYGPYACDGLFCTNSCAQAFGIAAAKRMIKEGSIKR